MFEISRVECVQENGYNQAILYRALDKSEYLVIIRDNFCNLCIKPYVVTTHLNRLNEMVQMRGNNIWFYA